MRYVSGAISASPMVARVTTKRNTLGPQVSRSDDVAKARKMLSTMVRTGYTKKADREKAMGTLNDMPDTEVLSLYKRHGTLTVFWLERLLQ